MPMVLSDWHRVTGLFVHSVKRWSQYYIQVLPEKGEAWLTVPEHPLFQMKVFGYRTRFHRMLARSRDTAAEMRRAEMAEWIRERYAELHPDQAHPEGVRFLRAVFPVGEMGVPESHWIKPDLDTLSQAQVSVIAAYDFSST